MTIGSIDNSVIEPPHGRLMILMKLSTAALSASGQGSKPNFLSAKSSPIQSDIILAPKSENVKGTENGAYENTLRLNYAFLLLSENFGSVPLKRRLIFSLCRHVIRATERIQSISTGRGAPNIARVIGHEIQIGRASCRERV